METQLADSLSTEKLVLQPRFNLNSFRYQLPVQGHLVSLQLQLFCGMPFSNHKKQYSYSIVGRLDGFENGGTLAELVSDYGAGNLFKDQLVPEQGRFIYSNQSLVPAVFKLRIRLKGQLPADRSLSADIQLEMKYTLKNILIRSVTSSHTVKPAGKAGTFATPRGLLNTAQ